MVFGFGGSASLTNSSSTSTTNANGSFDTRTTPLVPQWADTLTQDVAGRISGLNQLDPQSLVAGVNPLQTQAGAGAQNLNDRPWLLDSAVGETGYVMGANAPQVGQAATASPYIQQYMDPYLKDVVGATDAELSAHEGQVRAQQALDLAGSGAFGGSGAALTQSMTEGELARARASTLSGLRSQGYTQALGAAQQDAQRSESAKELNAQLRSQQMDRALTAARQLTGLSNDYDANTRANIATQGQAGDMLRGVEQQQLQAPATSTQQVVAMLSGLPIQLFTGQDQQGTQSNTSTTNSKGSETNVSVKADGSFDWP
jgi:hypothetical protein